MADSRERTFAEKLSTWVQIMGILVASGWGVYTFIYKEISLPRSAPINVSVKLDLRRIGTTIAYTSDQHAPITDVEMQISMTNPSSRKVDLLPSVWIAFGYRFAPTDTSDVYFNTRASAALNMPLGFIERGFTRTSNTVLSTGRLFTDTFLKPNESVTRTHILHIPANTYDVLEVGCFIPSASDASHLDVEWRIDSTGSLRLRSYYLDKERHRTPITGDSLKDYGEPPIEFQQSSSRSQISLR